MDIVQQLAFPDLPDSMKVRLSKFRGRELPPEEEYQSKYKVKLHRNIRKLCKLEEITLFSHPNGLSIQEKKELDAIMLFSFNYLNSHSTIKHRPGNLRKIFSAFYKIPFSEEALEKELENMVMLGTITH